MPESSSKSRYKFRSVARYVKDIMKADSLSARQEIFLILLAGIAENHDWPEIKAQIRHAGAEDNDCISLTWSDSTSHHLLLAFEQDISKFEESAQMHLKEYTNSCCDAWSSNKFTIIITDFLLWHVYIPVYSGPNSSSSAGIHKYELILLEKFLISASTGIDEFYSFLGIHLDRPGRIPATLNLMNKYFGRESEIFLAAFNHLDQAYRKIRTCPAIAMERAAWEKCLSIAQGKMDISDSNFLIHSYLSALAKMLAHIAIRESIFISDSELRKIMTGEAFRQIKVMNFTDNDFFSWTARDNPDLAKPLIIMATGLERLDFGNIREDILKGVYQGLQDNNKRHGLGEHYTPDWLCNKIVAAINPQPGQKILDPSCGSGSFLMAAARNLIDRYPDISCHQLNDCLYGIDINPLSVQIARATLLLAYGPRICTLAEPLYLNIFHANALLQKDDENPSRGGCLSEGQSGAKLVTGQDIRLLPDETSFPCKAFQNKFDIVVGNPPWLVYRDITNGEYKEAVRKIARLWGAMPDSESLFTHLELAAIFTGHSLGFFLKPRGILAFVMPRSIFMADQHHKMREGKIAHFKLKELWDLAEVQTLFNVPSCVLFCEKGNHRQTRADAVGGREILCKHATTSNQHDKNLQDKPVTFHFSTLNGRNAWSVQKINLTTPSYYKDKFRQGANLVPRPLCFVEMAQAGQPWLKDEPLKIQSARTVYQDAKMPWKLFSLSGLVHARFLFATFIANNVAPFGLIGSNLVALPLRNDLEAGNSILTPDSIEAEGCKESADWFRRAGKYWHDHKTLLNKDKDLYQYMNWQNKLLLQNFNGLYTVAYNRAGANASCVVIERTKNKIPYIIDTSMCWMASCDENEAYYLCAFLNSNIPNQLIKPFQSEGLFGARNIHKKILEVPLPPFDDKNAIHMELASLAKKASKKSARFIIAQQSDNYINRLDSIKIGKFRNTVRSYVKTEMNKIDKLINKLLD